MGGKIAQRRGDESLLRTALAVACLSALVAPAAGAAEGCDAAGERATVVGVIDARTLALEDGTTLRLAGLARGGPPTDDDDAIALLHAEALDRDLAFRPASARPDRYGRLVAARARPAGAALSLQEALVSQGLAKVAPFADNAGCVAALLDHERVARNAGRGLWASASERFVPAGQPAEVMRHVGQFALIQGQVVSVGQRRVRTYLNFGTYWNEDFTVIIARRMEDRFVERLGPLGELAGRLVRIRGWVLDDRGPAIEAEFPEQIDVVEDGVHRR